MEEILKRNGLSSISYCKRDNPRDYHLYKSLELEAEYLKKTLKLNQEMGKSIAQKENRGGLRSNAGRKSNTGFTTIAVRIPKILNTPVMALCEVFAEWMNREDPDFNIKRKVDDNERKRALSLFEILKDFEENKNT